MSRSGHLYEQQSRDFSLVADAIRKAMEPAGFHVHINSNQQRITLTEVGYSGGGESSILVSVKEIPRV